MKKLLFVAAMTCLFLLTSCGVSRVRHTGDLSGAIYGVWALESKNQVDYSGVHFYLSLSEPRIALAKKGSFTKTLWLTQGLKYEIRLFGTFKVLEMTRTKLVIQKESLGGRTTYTFRRYK